jgi:hypothetical protein
MLALPNKGVRMSFSYSAIWDDAVALTRRHAPLVTAIAGVFIFLPALVFAVFLKPDEPQTQDLSRMIELMVQWYEAVAPWLFLQILIAMIGAAAILRLVFAPETTVGGALAFAVALLPFYFLMSLICGLMVTIGAIFLIIPGLYLYGRVATAGAIMVAERRRNPIDAIRRSFELTRGRVWAILGLVLIVAIVGGITIGVATALSGIVFHLIAGRELGDLLTTILSSVLGAGFSTLTILLFAAIYRALVPPTEASVFQ